MEDASEVKKTKEFVNRSIGCFVLVVDDEKKGSEDRGKDNNHRRY